MSLRTRRPAARAATLFTLPRLPHASAARRSISAVTKRGSVAASKAATCAASNVTAAASAVASNVAATANSVATSVSSAVSVSVTVGGNMLRRPNPRMQLPALEDRRSVKLPQLALEGPEDERPSMNLHNVGLIRWVFEEARDIHLARPEYKARGNETFKTEARMHSVIFREVCVDVLAATRKCCNAYRAVELLSETARQKAESRRQAFSRLQKVKTKLFVTGVLGKMLRNVREESFQAEQMWKQCCMGLSMSLALASQGLGFRGMRDKAKGEDSHGLRYIASGSRSCATWKCGSISLGLRKNRRAIQSAQVEESDDVAVFPKTLVRA